MAKHIRDQLACESHLELQFETLYRRFFLPEVRGGTIGSKKRYAGLIQEKGAEEIEFVGLESVRRDWTEASKRFQHELLDRVFHDRPVDDFIRDFVRDLRSGRFDARLTYKKAMRKQLDAYTKTTPPHVRAARESGQTGRMIEYVMTSAGPQALGNVSAGLDYDHYVEHQIKPVAQAVLRFLGGDFDDITGARRQLALF
jgi:DNA polymerase II